MNPYEYINKLNKFGEEGGFNPGLERINLILEQFAHPENKIKVIHIAGSNGKGSTIAFLRSVYTQAGYNVGAYISPPIYKFNERITINNIPINTEELTEIVYDIDSVIKDLKKEEKILQPSFFEFITAIAYLYFYKKEVDIALMEVGLGGRLDATNIVKSPLVSVITSISLEHSAILGDTIAKIAREKAGIIKEARPVITGVEQLEAQGVIESIADREKVSLINVDKKYKYKVISTSLKGQKVLVDDNNTVRKFAIPLLGRHQIKNALLALGVIDKLKGLLPVSEDDLKTGIASTSWPGRLEIISRNPVVIIDGAHNSDGIKMLAKFMDENFLPGQRIFIILGILNDKNVREMLAYLNIDKFNIEFIITMNENKRALQPEKIKKVAEEIDVKNKIFKRLEDAINNIIKNARDDDVILVTGSLYTVREAKIIL